MNVHGAPPCGKMFMLYKTYRHKVARNGKGAYNIMKKIFVTFDPEQFANPSSATAYATDTTATTARAVVSECMETPTSGASVPPYYIHSILWECIHYTQRTPDAVAVLYNATSTALSDYGVYIGAHKYIAFYKGICICNTTISKAIYTAPRSRLVRAGVLADNMGAERCARCGGGVYDSNLDAGSGARRYVVLSDGRIVYLCKNCVERLMQAEYISPSIVAPRPYSIARGRSILAEVAYTYPLHGGGRITRDMLLRGAYKRCRACGRYYSPDELGAYMGKCPTCAHADGWRVCTACGAIYNIHDANASEFMCPTCNEEYHYKELINRYHKSHYTGTPFFDVNGKIAGGHDNFCGLGVELEINASEGTIEDSARTIIAKTCDNMGILADGRATLEEDGSVRGAELISAPHTLEAFDGVYIPMLRKVCDTLARDKRIDPCNEHTGLHVHVSRNVYGNDRDALARLLYLFATYADEFEQLSERASHTQVAEYCTPIADFIDNLDTARNYAERDSFGTRYVAINLENAYTIEFRLWQGKVNAEWVRDCADMCYYLTERARDMDDANVTNTAEWFKYAPANVARMAKQVFNI